MRRVLLAAFVVLACARLMPGACPALNQFQPNPAGESPYRPLPVLAPDQPEGGTLTLDMHMRRFGGPNDAGRTLRIGNYNVGDVPVFVITPQAGTKALLLDAGGRTPQPISIDCLQDPGWIFGGTLWQLMQSDQLRVTLQSDLDYDKNSSGAIHLPVNGSVPCRATNLHTHGFLVPPTQPANPTGLYGDFALDVTMASGSLTGGKDDCGDPIVSHAGHKVLSTPIHYGITI